MRQSQFAMKFTGLKQRSRYGVRNRATIPKTFYPKAPFLLRHFLYRRYLNMNTILLVVGGVRTGKSYLALKIAEQYCKILKIPFDVTKQCSFDILPFLEWSRGAMDSAFVLDEVGVNLNPQEWYTVQARVFRNFTQAQGFRRNVMILVLPNAKFLLSSIRSMCNYVLETRNQGYARAKKVTINYTKGKAYYLNMGGVKFNLPTKKTIKAYENMKKVWNDNQLNIDIQMLQKSEFDKKRKLNEFYEGTKVIPVVRQVQDQVFHQVSRPVIRQIAQIDQTKPYQALDE